MGWSTQAAVVSGGRLQLPATARAQINVPNVTSVDNGTQLLLSVAGPGMAATGHAGWAQLIFWSDTPTSTGGNWFSGGAHIDVNHLDTNQVPFTPVRFDISGLWLASSGTPATPPQGCYIFYAGGSLWAIGPSGNSILLATT